MYRTNDPATIPNFFAEQAVNFFTDNDIEPFLDAVGAMEFILLTDDIVKLYVTHQRESGVEFPSDLLLKLGSALGEAFRLVFDGEWEFFRNTEQWEIGFELPSGDRISVNVYDKLARRFTGGASDSISDLFNMIKTVYLDEASFLPAD